MTPIPSQRARESSVGKTPSFSFCQVDKYAMDTNGFVKLLRLCHTPTSMGSFTIHCSKTKLMNFVNLIETKAASVLKQRRNIAIVTRADRGRSAEELDRETGEEQTTVGRTRRNDGG